MIPPMMNSKRKIEDGEEGESQSPSKLFISEHKPIPTANPISLFKCKTCGKEFKTCQALGGHRASHTYKNPNSVFKKSSHECRICHKQFETGQSLGGHMRKHREKDESKGSTSSNSDVIHEEKSTGEGTRGDRSALVTRDFFPVEPMWVSATPVEVVRVLERADSWLELKLDPPGGYFKKRRNWCFSGNSRVSWL